MAASTLSRRAVQVQGGIVDLGRVLDALNDTPIIARLQRYRWTGRKGYSIEALWRSYVASFVLNLPHTNALLRRLEDDEHLRDLCGFDTLPHRTTFNRFIQRLSFHTDLVETCLADLTERLRCLLPDIGQDVAVDSTTVRSHSNPNRKCKSDPQASWTAKNSAGAKEGGKEWHFGYKVHMAADANYGIPLGHLVTTAKRNDSPFLPRVIEKVRSLHPWFHPASVIADRGYDSKFNHEYLNQSDILPIIHMRRASHTKNGLHDGIYTEKGIPTCVGMVPMEYVRSDPELGYLYRCRQEGCSLSSSTAGGIRHCDSEVWEDPTKNIRLFGVIRRDGPEWKALYDKRQAIERVFKSMKESRRLERHCVRGLRQITLHATMSALAFQATALTRVLVGQEDMMGWMVRKVA